MEFRTWSVLRGDMSSRQKLFYTYFLLFLFAFASALLSMPVFASSPGSLGTTSNPCRIFGWAFDQKGEYAYPKVHIYVDGAPAKRKHVYAINEADGYPMKPIRCY
jgi:hypothetical protein